MLYFRPVRRAGIRLQKRGSRAERDEKGRLNSLINAYFFFRHRWLVAAFAHEIGNTAIIDGFEEFVDVECVRLQQNAVAQAPDAHPDTRKPKFFRQPDGLALSVAKELGVSYRLRHRIYRKYILRIPREKPILHTTITVEKNP